MIQEHEIKFNNSAERLRKANLHLQPDKCEFLRPEVGYLGHIIVKNKVGTSRSIKNNSCKKSSNAINTDKS